jgi:hypothetical protein
VGDGEDGCMHGTEIGHLRALLSVHLCEGIGMACVLARGDDLPAQLCWLHSWLHELRSNRTH